MKNQSFNPILNNKITLFLSKLIPQRSLRRLTRAKIVWHIEHVKVVKYLYEKYIALLLQNKLKHYEFKPKKQFKDEKIIWQLWLQGKDEAPALIQKCFASVAKHMSDYTIIILDEKSIKEYLDLPEFVYEKKELFGKPFFSDLLRVCLLSTYGGIWFDASLFLSARVDERICQKDFFVFQRSVNPPKDHLEWMVFDPLYFSWDKAFRIKMLSSFIVARKKHKIILALQDMLLHYYENEQKLRHYFSFQILFDLLIENEPYKSLNCEITNDTDVHLIQFYSKKTCDKNMYKQILAQSFIHKLTQKDMSKNSLFLKALDE